MRFFTNKAVVRPLVAASVLFASTAASAQEVNYIWGWGTDRGKNTIYVSDKTIPIESDKVKEAARRWSIALAKVGVKSDDILWSVAAAGSVYRDQSAANFAFKRNIDISRRNGWLIVIVPW